VYVNEHLSIFSYAKKCYQHSMELRSRTYTNISPSNNSCHSSPEHSPVCSKCGSSSSPLPSSNNDFQLQLPIRRSISSCTSAELDMTLNGGNNNGSLHSSRSRRQLFEFPEHQPLSSTPKRPSGRYLFKSNSLSPESQLAARQRELSELTEKMVRN